VDTIKYSLISFSTATRRLVFQHSRDITLYMLITCSI
jgi:hypothetical protein